MTLKDFVENFVEHNSLIRLVYKNRSGHELVLDDWDDVSMDHQLLKGGGKFWRFAECEVLGVTSIDVGGHYPEAINIVIERPNNLVQPQLKSLFNPNV